MAYSSPRGHHPGYIDYLTDLHKNHVYQGHFQAFSAPLSTSVTTLSTLFAVVNVRYHIIIVRVVSEATRVRLLNNRVRLLR